MAPVALVSTRKTIRPFVFLVTTTAISTAVICLDLTRPYSLVTVFAAYTEALRVNFKIIIHLIQINRFLPEHVIRCVVNVLVSELHGYIGVLIMDRDI